MNMLVTLAVILVVLWILGLTVFKIAGFALHLLLIVAIIMIVLGLVRRVR